MPKLLVRVGKGRHQYFEIPPGESTIGRGSDTSLLLPNVSVSRLHCKIIRDGGRVVVSDTESQNGVLVNGKNTRLSELKSGDQLQVGKFLLVYMGDGPEDRFYKGRCVAYLPKYEPEALVPQGDGTMALSVDALQKISSGNRIVESARLVWTADATKYWYPEDRKLSLGKGGMVKVTGWFTGGIVANIEWDGSKHVLHKRGLLGHVSVNGQGISERPLKAGDTVRVGNSVFRYELKG